MCYSGPMGLSMEIPVHQVSGPEKLWGIGGYGSSKDSCPIWNVNSSVIAPQSQ